MIKILKIVYNKITNPVKHPVTAEIIHSIPIEHHSLHIAIALLGFMIGSYTGVDKLYLAIGIPILLILKKVVLHDRSPWQTVTMYWKDIATDYNQYSIVWCMYFLFSPMISASILFGIVVIYIYTIYKGWAYP